MSDTWYECVKGWVSINRSPNVETLNPNPKSREELCQRQVSIEWALSQCHVHDRFIWQGECQEGDLEEDGASKQLSRGELCQHQLSVEWALGEHWVSVMSMRGLYGISSAAGGHGVGVGSASAQMLGGREVSVRSVSTQRQVLRKISARWVYEEQYMREMWYQCIRHGVSINCHPILETLRQCLTLWPVMWLCWPDAWPNVQTQCPPQPTSTHHHYQYYYHATQKARPSTFSAKYQLCMGARFGSLFGALLHIHTPVRKFLFFFCDFSLHGTDNNT